MTGFPCLERWVHADGQFRYRLGHPLVDRYLEFVAGRARPNTLRAVTFDLKTFFTVVAKSPEEVKAVDVFDFLADQRGDRTVVRLVDRESGLAARTIARRISSISGFYSYLMARGDRWRSTRCRGACRLAVRAGRTGLGRCPWCGCRAPCRGSWIRATPTGCCGHCALTGTGRWCWPCCWAGCAAARFSGFVSRTCGWASGGCGWWGKGGHHRVVPVSDRFFEAMGDYLHTERPKQTPSDQLFGGAETTASGPAAIGRRARRDPGRRPRPGRTGARHLSRAAPHLFDPLTRSRDGPRSGPGPGRASQHRVHPDLSASE
jgi:integrase/recombinase XerD